MFERWPPGVWGIIDLKSPPELATGWRAEIVGQLIDRVLDGTVAMRVDNPKSEQPLSLEYLKQTK